MDACIILYAIKVFFKMANKILILLKLSSSIDFPEIISSNNDSWGMLLRQWGLWSALDVHPFTVYHKNKGDIQDPQYKQVLSCFFFLNGGQNIQVIPQARATYYIVSSAEASGSFTLNMVAGQRLKFLPWLLSLSHIKTESTVSLCQLPESLLTMSLQVNRKEFQSHNLKACKNYWIRPPKNYWDWVCFLGCYFFNNNLLSVQI